ncbi:MAG: signal peptidase II, partial [Saprospiraceae bacterium]|nr:signal peptidase II [Saprospiraceae bacterium]
MGGIAGGIIFVDQISKWYVRQLLPVNGIWAPWDWLMPYARLFHTQNTGVAFGMFKGANTFFAILAVIVSIAIIYYYPRIPSEDWTLRIA